MPAIHKLMCQLNDPSRLMVVRHAIATTMLEHLRTLQAQPRTWNKAHFANAVAAFVMNVNSVQQPTHAWLRLCLVDLRKAVDSIEPGTPYARRNLHLDAVTLEEMITSIEVLNERV